MKIRDASELKAIEGPRALPGRELGASEVLTEAARIRYLETGVLTEQDMAAYLRIPAKTLGNYRRQGRFPNCWVRNGKHIRWLRDATIEAWRRGIC